MPTQPGFGQAECQILPSAGEGGKLDAEVGDSIGPVFHPLEGEAVQPISNKVVYVFPTKFSNGTDINLDVTSVIDPQR